MTYVSGAGIDGPLGRVFVGRGRRRSLRKMFRSDSTPYRSLNDPFGAGVGVGVGAVDVSGVTAAGNVVAGAVVGSVVACPRDVVAARASTRIDSVFRFIVSPPCFRAPLR